VGDKMQQLGHFGLEGQSLFGHFGFERSGMKSETL
jgi:hypothetical protein